MKNEKIVSSGLTKLIVQLEGIHAQILGACDHIPKSVSQGSFNRARDWKALAVKWRKKASTGVPKDAGEQKLVELIADAGKALNDLRG
jgi:hypothetical protein